MVCIWQSTDVCMWAMEKEMFSSLFQRKCLQSRPRCYACLVNRHSKPYIGVYRIRLHTPPAYVCAHECERLRIVPTALDLL